MAKPGAPQTGRLLAGLPDGLSGETYTALLEAPGVRIERILSQGQASPEVGWYDQNEHEWVVVLQGAARLEIQNGPEVFLGPGDYVHLPAHCRHRVLWTPPEEITVWLAVFYGAD